MSRNIWVVGKLNQLSINGSYTATKSSKNSAVTGKAQSFVVGPFCTSHSIQQWALTEQFCMETLLFHSWYFQLKMGTPAFLKRFSFSKKFASKLKH